jgi:hypothetical protein
VAEPLLVRIGDITVSFALLESEIQGLAHALLGRHQRVGQIITAQVSFPQLCTLATRLYRERNGDDADLEVLRELMARAADLGAKRNQIVHSVWGAGKTRETVTRIKVTAKADRAIRFDFVDVGSDDLRVVADDLKHLADEVQRFTIALVEAGKAGS